MNRDIALRSYLSKNFFLDLLATLPFDYLGIAMLSDSGTLFARIIRILRFLKFYRIVENVKLLKKYKKVNIGLLNIALLYFAFISSSHIFNCVTIHIGKLEYLNPSRFDGKSLLN